MVIRALRLIPWQRDGDGALGQRIERANEGGFHGCGAPRGDRAIRSPYKSSCLPFLSHFIDACAETCFGVGGHINPQNENS